MSLTQCIVTGIQLVQELYTTLPQVDHTYTEEQLAYDQAAARLSDNTFAEALETQFGAKLLYVTWQGACWNLDCYRNPVNKLRLHTDYEELHGEYHFPSPRYGLPRKPSTPLSSGLPQRSKNWHGRWRITTPVWKQWASSWPTSGFQRRNAFFPKVIPGYSPDLVLTAKYIRVVSTDVELPI